MPILPILVGLLGLVTLLSLFRRGQWPMELIQHFRPHLILSGALGALLCLALGERWEWSVISLGLALVNYAALPAPRWVKLEAHLAGSSGLTIVWANVWQDRQALERTLDWAKAQKADLILIGECPKGELSGLLAGDYPHRFDSGQPSDTTYSVRMAAFSRTPINSNAVHQGPGPNERPWLSFSVAIDDRMLSVVGAHPMPPYYPKLAKERDTHIAALGAQLHEPFVLAGDFNTTPWCPAYAAIPGRRIGAYLFAPTWFNNLPLLGLPIDHIMVSSTLKASAYQVAPSTGSDHYAIMARVHLPTTLKT